MLNLSVLFVNFVLYVVLILPSPKGYKAQTCSPSLVNVYAADNLHNGTIRLYSMNQVWELNIYDSHGSGQQIQSNLIDTSEYQLSAFVDRTMSKPISNFYQNLTFPVEDNQTMHISMVSLSDYNDLEYTFLLKTLSGQVHLNSEYMFWNTQDGSLQNLLYFSNSNGNGIHDFTKISATFRAYLNESQYLFILMNRKFFSGKVEIQSFLDPKIWDNVHLMEDSNNQLHHGLIPANLTAAFVIQPNSQDIWICIVKCNHYCLVPFVKAEYFDFNKCAGDEQNPWWKSIDKTWFAPSANVQHLLNQSTKNDKQKTSLIYKNYVVYNRNKFPSNLNSFKIAWKVFNATISMRNQLHALVQSSSLIFKINSDGKNIALATFSLSMISYLVLMLCVVCHVDNKSYNIAKVEYRNSKRRHKQEELQDQQEPVEDEDFVIKI